MCLSKKRAAVDLPASSLRPRKRPSEMHPSPALADHAAETQAGVPDNSGVRVLDDFYITSGTLDSSTVVGDDMPLGAQRRTDAARHRAIVPTDMTYNPLAEHTEAPEPAKTFPFVLDPFQRTSISCIERHESVLVSAHTSAGKTVVAEYAIARCLKSKQRIIYTSPIKALSNQKYRDLSAEFSDVGLITGDVTVNPNASCLVMTTEVLRSMLYHNSESVREVAWVVFDEIHYLKDKQRGVVWEETIILLPRQVRYVFLSATVPNALQFSQWIAHLHHQICHVVSTNWRPTPLQYYLYPQSADGLYLVLDKQGAFQDTNFRHAMDTLKLSSGGRGRHHGPRDHEPNDMHKLVKMLVVESWDPIVVFAFSRRECEVLAMQTAKMDLNSGEEKNSVNTVFRNAISILSAADQSLPQIKYLLPLLERGIGIHHGALLPILREVVEILFQDGLIKVLFATETFSIGLNMPAKTVVFTSIRKWDGKRFRHLTSGEMIQMSGRAGRRGLDDQGTVILMIDEPLAPEAVAAMICGQADRLDSGFHLTDHMVLNWLRSEGVKPELMLQRSFYHFQQSARVSLLERDLQEAQARASSIHVPHADVLDDLDRVQQQLDVQLADRVAVTSHPSYALPFLQTGRVVRIQAGTEDFGWGATVAFQKRRAPKDKDWAAEYERVQQDPQHAAEQYIVDVLVRISTSAGGKAGSGAMRPADTNEEILEVVPVLLSCVKDISAVRLSLPRDIRPRERRVELTRALTEVVEMGEGGPPLLDPVEDMKIVDEAFDTLLKKTDMLRKRQRELRNELARALVKGQGKENHAQNADVARLKTIHTSRRAAEAHADELAAEVGAARNAVHLADLRARKRTLHRLGYVTDAEVVQHKGRVACEIVAADALILTELVYEGAFRGLTPALCAALVSVFVVEGRAGAAREAQVLPDALRDAMRALDGVARRVSQVSRESGLVAGPSSAFEIRLERVDCVLGWCAGKSFDELVRQADELEGTLVRDLRRLAELLRQLTEAARAVGNPELEDLFQGARELLERNDSVVFSPSLYL